MKYFYEMRKGLVAVALLISAAFMLPAIAFAVSDIFSLSQLIYDLFARLGVLFWALATMLFVWGVVKFIKNANDTAEHEKGKQLIVWGIIAFVVLVSLWGIVEIVLSDTLGINSGGELQYIDKNNSTL